MTGLEEIKKMFCKHCQETKLEIDFPHRGISKQTGKVVRRTICGKCNYKKQKLKDRREYLVTMQKKWRSKNKLKFMAYNAVAAAIANGVLIHPEKCSECNKIKKVEGHHDDYTKPLVVIWLCSYCHKLRHKLLRMK